ncbi:MAG: TonB-dependent receptor plug domain-containing protein [Bacteroidales bacterium]
MKRTVLMFAAMMTTVVMAWSQPAMEGVVRDRQTGAAIAGAHVFLNESYRSTFTDAEGRFRFSRLDPGVYQLMITHIAFSPYQRAVTVTEKGDSVGVLLEPRIHLSEEFIVSALRPDDRVSGATSVISKQELKAVNFGQDLPYLLSTTPSLVMTSDAGTGIGYTGMRIRGVDQNRINVTINGVPLNDPESHAVYWVDLPDFASSVEDIQIQRGVGTSTNGAGAFGGSVNIRTEQLNKDPYASMSHVFGSFNTMKNNLSFGSGLIGNRYAFDGRVSRISSDGFIDRASAKLNSFYLSGGYYGKSTVVKGVVMSGKEVTYQAWDGIPSEILDTNRTWNPQGLYYDEEGVLRAYENQVDDYLQTHYQLHVIQRINPRWNANVAIHLTTGKGFYESYKSDRKLKDYDLPLVIYGTDTITRTDLIQRKWLDNRFYGATWSLARSAKRGQFAIGGALNTYDGDHFGTLVWLRHQGSVSRDHEWYRGDGVKREASLYTRYLHQATAKTVLFADLQVRDIHYVITGTDDDLRDIGQSHDYFFFNPKAGASFLHNDRHETYLLTGIANREPNRSNFTDAGADGPVPGAERLFNAELGHKITHDRLSALANLYIMYYRDQLVLTGEINDVGSPVMTNVDKSYRAGVELVAGMRFTPWFTWEANATMSRNRIIGFVAFIDDWDTWGQRSEELGNTEISFSPSLVASNILRFIPVKQLSVALVSQYVSRQYLDNTGSVDRSLDPWFVNNIHVRYELKVRSIRELTLNLMLNNILNAEYESNGWVYRYYEDGVHKTSDGLFPQAGFHILGSVAVKF